MCMTVDPIEIFLMSVMGVAGFCACVLMVKITVIDIFSGK